MAYLLPDIKISFFLWILHSNKLAHIYKSDFKIMVLSHLGQNMFTLTAAPQCSHRFLSCRKSTMIRINLSNRVAGNFFLRKRVINTSIKMICAEVFLSPFFFTEKNHFETDFFLPSLISSSSYFLT